jgi:hypothetical protein
MSKQPTKYKTKPKKETIYFKEITFKGEPTFEERESIVRRALIQEQAKHKILRWIIAEKDMKMAKIKFFTKTKKNKSYGNIYLSSKGNKSL